MMITMPRYEFKFSDKEDWQEISEVELMDGLYRIYDRVTPAIQKMIKGKELRTPYAVYRLKMEGNFNQTTKV